MRLAILAVAVLMVAPADASDVLLMNRIGPSTSELFIADSDGARERRLLAESGRDYNASFSSDGQWILFTSERNGDGQADLYRVRADGSALERLTDDPAMDDQGALSPDGGQLAFVSTRGTRKAHVWILDLKTRQARTLTAVAGIEAAADKPGGFFRPTWSPDGQWIAFSSDRGTDWKGHRGGRGWEHVQELAVYVIRPDGRDFRRVAATPGTAIGAPRWSPDGRRLVVYEIPVEATFAVRIELAHADVVSQIVSFDVQTGARMEHTSGPGIKLAPQFVDRDRIGYLVKAGATGTLHYTGGQKVTLAGRVRAPSWSPDGRRVVYERTDFAPRPQNQRLFGWVPGIEYRYTDVFPTLAADGRLAVTDFLSTLSTSNSSISIMNADGSDKRILFKDKAGGAAYAATWSPDGQWLAFGLGGYLANRSGANAGIKIVRSDGSDLQDLTPVAPNAGFPSWSRDGSRIVYRVWGDDQGLRFVHVASRAVTVLTKEYDNVPEWSPIDDRIMFTRRGPGGFDIYTIQADGSGLRQITTTPGNDAHAVWTPDGRSLVWSSSRTGFKDEAITYDNNPQPYAALFMMGLDGSNVRQLTDSRWEDAMPRFVPRVALAAR